MSRWPSTEEMQERILETADRLFYRQGIRAVGVDTIADEIGISKRTLYNYYPSKDALIVAYMSRRLVALDISDRPPLDQILGVFDGLERSVVGGRFRGCAFINAVAEMGAGAPEAHKLAVTFKENRRLWFRELLSRLGIEDKDRLATQIAILLDGAIATALVRGNPAMIGAAKEAAAQLIATATQKKERKR
jgi:AcrR family transcriptional regulator